MGVPRMKGLHLGDNGQQGLLPCHGDCLLDHLPEGGLVRRNTRW